MFTPQKEFKMKKHKRHKSERGERIEDSSDKPPALKLILKVGGNMSTPEHSNDSMGPSNASSIFGTPLGSTYGAANEEESMSLQSLPHPEKHKKMKKKKKKKEKDKNKDKHEKKHKHRHKEKRKRSRERLTLEDVGEDALLESPKKPHIEITPAPPPPTPKQEDPPKPILKPLSPIRPPVSPRTEAREQRSCVIRLKQEHTPFMKFLEHLLRLLEKKDPQQFFAWPVTDSFAPGYSSVISNPMDFSTMQQKIEDHLYNTLAEFIADFKLMCTNAMTYNLPDTIYFKAAKKLLHHGLRILSEDKIKPLIVVLPYMCELTVEELGFSLGFAEEETPQDEKTDDDTENKMDDDEENREPREMPKSKFEAIQDDLSSSQILKQAQKAANEAAQKLAHKKASCLGFLRQRRDGTTSLNILVPNEGVAPGTNERPVLLGQLIGKLTHGTGQLQGFKEDRRNLCKPIKPLNYGAFSSYAPSYDTTFSNLTKEESDLVYQTYGDETSVQYAESILDFAKDCDYALTMVDNLLDLMTNGDHRRSKKFLEERKKLKEEEEKIREMMEPATSAEETEVDFQALRTLADVGIDTKFLDAFEPKPNEPIDEVLQARLNENTSLIQKLHKVQTDRLSQMPPAHLAHIPGASDSEFELAEKITESLTELSKRLPPEAVAPTSSIRKALGVTEPPVADFESELREFLESESALNVDHSPLHDDNTIEEILSVSES